MTPRVCAICLTSDRQEYTDRVVKCFLSQTYTNSELLIFDTGADPYDLPRLSSADSKRIMVAEMLLHRGDTIGDLRNSACHLARFTDILMTWDSDDWSAPTRIEHQVNQLVSGQYQIVGFNQMLFNRSGEAWQFENWHPDGLLGTSLAYWRSVWRERPFKSTSAGEEHGFLIGRRKYGEPAFIQVAAGKSQPLMIGEIHAGNTSDGYRNIETLGTHWKREPGWDQAVKDLIAR